MEEKSSLWERCLAFHGHACPGLAIGYRACEAVMEKWHFPFSNKPMEKKCGLP